jgi:hypothetical protein
MIPSAILDALNSEVRSDDAVTFAFGAMLSGPAFTQRGDIPRPIRIKKTNNLIFIEYKSIWGVIQ